MGCAGRRADRQSGSRRCSACRPRSDRGRPCPLAACLAGSCVARHRRTAGRGRSRDVQSTAVGMLVPSFAAVDAARPTSLRHRQTVEPADGEQPPSVPIIEHSAPVMRDEQAEELALAGRDVDGRQAAAALAASASAARRPAAPAGRRCSRRPGPVRHRIGASCGISAAGTASGATSAQTKRAPRGPFRILRSLAAYSAGSTGDRALRCGGLGLAAALFEDEVVALGRRSACCLVVAAPVPAGMRRPTMTFSLRPSSRSALPETAASVRTRVVSWNEAAEMNAAGLQRRLGDAEQDRVGRRRLLAVGHQLVVELVEVELVELLVLEHARVTRVRRSRPSAASGGRSPRCACR